MRKQSKGFIVVSTIAAGVLLAGGLAFAAGGPPGWGGRAQWRGGADGAQGQSSSSQDQSRRPGVFGVVTAVNGTTLTVESHGFAPDAANKTATSSNAEQNRPRPSFATTTYMVNAANATVIKNGTSSSVSAIHVNDRVMVRGTVSGTAVTATSIVDGLPAAGGMGLGRFKNGTSSWERPTGTPALAALKGNGEPVVGGTVTAVNGNMFTITNASNVTYSIVAQNATVVKNNETSTYSVIAVNDRVIVQGTVNGTRVTASSVIDRGPSLANAKKDGTSTSTIPRGRAGGFVRGLGTFFFGGVGSFFHNLFGFF